MYKIKPLPKFFNNKENLFDIYNKRVKSFDEKWK